MEEYIKVNILNYVKNGIEKGLLYPIEAVKTARIIARRGVLGEEIISWSVDLNGNKIKEKVDTVKIDEYTNVLDWVVTKVDEKGEPIIDKNGYLNQWIIADSVFKKKYEVDLDNPGLFKPVGGIQIFVQIPDNIILHQWGSDMKIAKGGYINITNLDDMYGISERDFNDTYRLLDKNEKKSRL